MGSKLPPVNTRSLVALIALIALVAIAAVGAGWKWHGFGQASGGQHLAGWTWDGAQGHPDA